jgi:hypothetical protein
MNLDINTYIYVYIYMYIWICIYINVCLQINLYKYVYMYIYIYMFTYHSSADYHSFDSVDVVAGFDRHTPPGGPPGWALDHDLGSVYDVHIYIYTNIFIHI